MSNGIPNTDPPDLAAISMIVHELRTAMTEIPEEPFRGAKTIFPSVWCEWASIGAAEVLKERGLGEWTFVSAGLPDSPSGHAWLELRDTDGTAMYSIDITLDQFDAWNAPYVGPGPSPAAARYRDERFAGWWRDWPVVSRNESFARYAKALVEGMRRK